MTTVCSNSLVCRWASAGESWAYGGDFAPTTSAPVDVVAGATVDVDVVAGRTFAVRGQVVDAAGVPVAGAQVGVLSVFDGSSHGPLGALAQPSLDTVSAADGRFAFAAPRTAKVKLFAYVEGGPASPIETLDLRDGNRDVLLQLRSDAALQGTVMDEEGAPLAGAHVTFLGGVGRKRALAESRRLRSVTGEDGSFALDPSGRDAEGVYRFLVEKEGYLGEMYEWSLPDATARFTLRASRRLEGVVRHARTDEPIQQFTVTLDVPDRHRGMGREVRAERQWPERSADGTFQTPPLARAETRITVEAAGFGSMSRDIVLSPGAPPVAEPLVFVLLPAIDINGVVEDAARNPIAGARVTVGSQRFVGTDGILRNPHRSCGDRCKRSVHPDGGAGRRTIDSCMPSTLNSWSSSTNPSRGTRGTSAVLWSSS